MKTVKAMYLPQVILARNISIEVPRLRSSPEIAGVNPDLYALPPLDSIHRLLCTVFGKFIRRRTVALVALASHWAELHP
jgi:hypothetical protein